MRAVFNLLLIAVTACGAVPTSGPPPFDLQGHRGARGHLPENTIPSFLLALDQGAITLELDVVVSGDGQVVVSHEPWFEADFSSLPGGEPVPEEEERRHGIYGMTYAQVAAYDVGSRGNPRFPGQRPVRVSKPRLGEVFALADAHARERGLAPPRYNVEVKSNAEWDGELTPAVDEFTRLVAAVVVDAGVAGRTTIQSFDERALRELRSRPGGVELALLIGKNEDEGLERNLARLGLTPDTYSPQHELVDAALVEACHARGVRIVPWTVNDRARMEELVALGVDGLITDYPDLGRGLARRAARAAD